MMCKCMLRYERYDSLTRTSTLMCSESSGMGASFVEVKRPQIRPFDVLRSFIESMLCFKGPYTAGGLSTTSSKPGEFAFMKSQAAC
jgi:hypothetical protein